MVNEFVAVMISMIRELPSLFYVSVANSCSTRLVPSAMQLPSISTLCLQTHDCKPGLQNVDMGIDIAMSFVDFLLRANASLLFLEALRCRWRPNAQSIPLPHEIKKVVKKAGEDLVPVQGEDPAARSLAPHGPARIIRSRNKHP